MMEPATPQYLRAPVIGHTVWVTRQHEDERWSCGAYPTQSTVDTGMTEWLKDDEPLENTDVVLWYVFGIHHITRVEDWPIMPADIVPFWLKPFGFFDQNPSIDVPPSMKADGRSRHTGAGAQETGSTGASATCAEGHALSARGQQAYLAAVATRSHPTHWSGVFPAITVWSRVTGAVV
jgi:hypothetical protein